MRYIQYFTPQPAASQIQQRLRDPFENNPHPLAIRASNDLKQRLNETPSLIDDQDSGKMFGVLVVADESGRIGYLAGFSGMLNRQWIVPGFVPPVFNIDEQKSFLLAGEARLNKLSLQIDRLLNSPARVQAQQYLTDLIKQQDEALAALRLQNSVDKKQRHCQRSAIKHDAEKDQRLVELSLLSQREKSHYKQQKSTWNKIITEAQALFNTDYENEIHLLVAKRRQLSRQLHMQVFETYRLKNTLGEVSALNRFFEGKVPPGGTGDCAAPKLLQFANNHKLRPLAMAEFWWGAAPADGVRHHGQYYPPCRGKCHPVLPYMLKGLEIQQSTTVATAGRPEPTIVYEDETIVVINKPCGLLSIPGKRQDYSVQSWLRQRYPEATGPLLVHRLDMATSGLLLAAKDAEAHKHLQKQFIERSIKKRYVAVLSKVIDRQQATIDLPLRVDLDDRPRQIVCFEHGKPAITHVRLISTDDRSSRVYFYPVTGRTHQLRVHAAHARGLSAPIIGDALYGTRSDRLLLHAEKLSFSHPLTGKRIRLKVKPAF